MELVQPIRTGVPPSHYQAYLNSPGWRTVRNRALKNAGYQCSKCPSRRSLEVHHLSYERLGIERDSDLEVLCSTCHRSDHLTNPDQTSLGIYLKVVSVCLKQAPFASIADLADMAKTECAQLKIPALEGRINSALAVVCGNRLQNAPRAVPLAPRVEPLAVTKAEAVQLLERLRAKFDAPLTIRQVPASTPLRKMDIYAPVPRPDYGDHDVY